MVTKRGSVSAQTLDKSQLLRMYEQMETIRVFEERAGRSSLRVKFLVLCICMPAKKRSQLVSART